MKLYANSFIPIKLEFEFSDPQFSPTLEKNLFHQCSSFFVNKFALFLLSLCLETNEIRSKLFDDRSLLPKIKITNTKLNFY